MALDTVVSCIELLRPSPDQLAVIDLVHISYSIGRLPPADIVVLNHHVSRLHAQIQREQHHYVLIDKNSRNGTFVNGQLLRGPHVLNHEDAIGLGEAAPALRFIDPDITVRPTHRIFFDPASQSFHLGAARLVLQPNPVSAVELSV